MAKTAKTSRLTPTPKALQKALEQSASQAQKLADAFVVKVPYARTKNVNSSKVEGYAEKIRAGSCKSHLEHDPHTTIHHARPL